MAQPPKKGRLTLYEDLLSPAVLAERNAREAAELAAEKKKKDAALMFKPSNLGKKRPAAKSATKPKATFASMHKLSSSTSTTISAPPTVTASSPEAQPLTSTPQQAPPQPPGQQQPSQKRGFSDWLANEDEEWMYEKRPNNANQNKKKKKNKQLQDQWSWEDTYDPHTPVHFLDYPKSEVQYGIDEAWKQRLYDARRKEQIRSGKDMKPQEQERTLQTVFADTFHHADTQEVPVNMQLAPPSAMSFAPPSHFESQPPQRDSSVGLGREAPVPQDDPYATRMAMSTKTSSSTPIAQDDLYTARAARTAENDPPLPNVPIAYDPPRAPEVAPVPANQQDAHGVGMPPNVVQPSLASAVPMLPGLRLVSTSAPPAPSASPVSATPPAPSKNDAADKASKVAAQIAAMKAKALAAKIGGSAPSPHVPQPVHTPSVAQAQPPPPPPPEPPAPIVSQPGTISAAPTVNPEYAAWKERQKARQEEDEDFELPYGPGSIWNMFSLRSSRPGQAGFAKRHMKRMGWEEGQGLGASGDGITTAIVGKAEKRKKRSDAEGGGFRTPANMGTIVGGKRAKPAIMGKNDDDDPDGPFDPMSEVIKLEGILANLDVDKEIQDNNILQEIGEEMNEFGQVERLFIWRDTMGGHNEVFVKFTSQLSALRAVRDMDGIEFAGNTVKASFWDAEKFERGVYE